MVIQKLIWNGVFKLIIISVTILSSCTLQRDLLKQKYPGLNKVPVHSSEVAFEKDHSMNTQNIDVNDLYVSLQQSGSFSNNEIVQHLSADKQKPFNKLQKKRELSDEVKAITYNVGKNQPDFKRARASVSELKTNLSVDPLTILIWLLIILLIAAILSILGIPLLELLVTILVIVLLVMLILYLYDKL